MKKLLIIKAGTTYPAIRSKAGDFDDMVIERAGLPGREVTVCPVYEKQPLPELSGIYATIITGSHEMVTDRADWSVYLANWIKETAYGKIPVLAICYAHQLAAAALGGSAGYHPRGLELGSTLIELTPEGAVDPLMRVLPARFTGHVTHAQTVTALPAGAKVLAHNSFEAHQAIAFGPNVWGLQFHPEFSADIVHLYIDEDKERLEKKGYDTAALHSSVVESPYGGTLLKRFIELAK
jgi:GMP synthase (glutamine-hydrolysing)